MTIGRSVRLYLVDGTATGILTAEIMNWTGHVLAAPRIRLEAALAREELKRTGIYILFGSDEESDLTKVYVGESDEIAKRLYQHNRDEQKSFWEKFVAITSKDMNLTKAHVKYLEGRILDLIAAAKKARIANKDNPKFDKLPEADISDMESFISEIELVLPVIGIDFLKRPKTPDRAQKTYAPKDASAQNLLGILEAKTTDVAEPTFFLKNVKAGIDAKAIETEGEFIILEGSIGSLKEKSSFHERNKMARDEAFASDRIEKRGASNFIAKEDIAFNSPSAAAVFLFGTSRNGRTDWLEEQSGVNYGTWKDMIIEASADKSF